MPESTRRVFPGYAPGDLDAHPAFVAERLLEEGETDDLLWLVGALGEDELAEIFARRGARLSRRRRAFWALVFSREPEPLPEAARIVREATWPL